jgi:hypothetical protein
MQYTLGELNALGIAVESPQRSEDLERKARPEGEHPKNNKNAKVPVL